MLLTQLFEITNVPAAIIDHDGNILVQAGWQPFCLDFHRQHPIASKLCRQNDQIPYTTPLEQPYITSTCPHGLIKSICPITVAGQHVANACIGQILHEPVSHPLQNQFRSRAKQYGFDENAYLEALKKTPVFSPAAYTHILDFFSSLTSNIATLASARLRELNRAHALQELEEQLHMTQEVINDGLWDWNAKKDVLNLSTRAYLLLGHKPNAFPLTFNTFLALVHPDDRSQTKEKFRQLISSDKPFRYEFRFLTASGTNISIMARGKVITRSSDQTAQRVFGIFTNITPLKHAEENFKKAFHKSPLLMSITDIQTGEFITANDKFSQVTDYPREELIGKRSIDLGLLSEADRSILQSSLEANEAISNHQLTLKNKDGSTRQYLSFFEIIKVQRRSKLLFIGQDITDQIKIEKENKLLEQQLRQVGKLDALGTLAGGIAHDFNNILSAILGHGQMALEQLSPSNEIHEDISQIMVAGNRAADLVKQILLFSRQEEEAFQPLQIQEIIKEAIGIFRASLPSSILFSESIAQSCGTIHANPTQIRQAIMNLCTNARQAIKNEYGSISIKLSVVSPAPSLFSLSNTKQTAENYACIEVKDSGCGISEKIKTKIFDPFFTTKGKGEGTGMGLAVVDGIVRKHFGFITMESAPGAGTTFQVYLPIIATKETAITPTKTIRPHGSERILLVDDEQMLNNVHKKALELYGYQVTCFSDSQKALTCFAKNSASFDIVVTDMTMPHLTGLDLIKKILKMKADTRSILCTGYSRSVSENKAKSFGVTAFLLKPFLPQVLAETIRKVLDHA